MCQGWANLLRYNCIHYSRQVTGNENHCHKSQFIISIIKACLLKPCFTVNGTICDIIPQQ